MSVNQLIEKLEQDNCVVMDGGLGSEIERRGMVLAAPLWSASVLLDEAGQGRVRDIHRENLESGAEIIIAGTFRSLPYIFAKDGRPREEAALATWIACRLAREAKAVAGTPETVIAASSGPLEDCYRPQDTPPDRVLAVEHAAHADNLVQNGTDLLYLPETMITLRETRAALKAGYDAGFGRLAVSFCGAEDGRGLLSGEPLEEAVALAERFEPVFIGVNCVDPYVATRAVERLTAITERPVAVYAQGGEDLTCPNRDETIEDHQAYYVEQAKRWRGLGAKVIGGCCGVSPAYIEAIRESAVPFVPVNR